MKGPIPDSYWVIPERLLAGEYPSSLRRFVTDWSATSDQRTMPRLLQDLRTSP